MGKMKPNPKSLHGKAKQNSFPKFGFNLRTSSNWVKGERNAAPKIPKGK